MASIFRKLDHLETINGAPPPKRRRTNVEAATIQPEQQIATVIPSPRRLTQCADESFTVSSLGADGEFTYRKASRPQLFPNGQTYGLRALYEPAAASEALADIIFVHGLAGDSYTTWLEAESGTYWPVHLLSRSLPNARIMTFGYDADVAKFLGPVSQNNLRDHASTLLGELAALRAEDNSVRSSLLYHASITDWPL
jgi:hypothetical protein